MARIRCRRVVVVASVMALFWAPTDAVQGNV